MSNKNHLSATLRPIAQKTRAFWFPPLLLILLLIGPLLSHSTPVTAKPQLSIPNLNSLQRKFFKKYRKRSRRSKRRNKINPALAPGVLGAQNNQANPPLPVRNPRHKAAAKRKREREEAPQREIEWSKPRPEREAVQKTWKKPAPLVPRYDQQETSGVAILAPPLPVRKPRRHPSKVIEAAWSLEFINKAKAQCAILGIEIELLAPVKKGLCGNPAPVLLQKIGLTTVHPAATLSCPMSASMQQWFNQYVQPLALKYFGNKVHKIKNVSSYVCRNRYGDTTTRISEHAYANALDIASFELEGGEIISVLEDWDNLEGNKSIFLRALHFSACKLFGTVLGPDANAAHKDHFHLDKAPRRRSNYCR